MTVHLGPWEDGCCDTGRLEDSPSGPNCSGCAFVGQRCSPGADLAIGSFIRKGLAEASYPCGYTAVKEAVRHREQLTREVFMPLIHPPGHARFDFGLADIIHDGQRLSSAELYDVIIQDIMLPGCDGFSVLRELRQRGIQRPVICLTARDAVYDPTGGLILGADDYLPKPFSFAELLARIRAVLRRSEGLSVISTGMVLLRGRRDRPLIAAWKRRSAKERRGPQTCE